MIKRIMPSGQSYSVETFRQTWGLVLLLTLAVLLLRVGYVQFWHPYGLAPDEAQYWSWLQHNDWSFLTKPPLTTWLIGISTLLLGKTMLGVKLFALLGQAAVSVLGFAMARTMAGTKNGERAGWWAWMLLTTAPLIAAGGLIMCPDAVLLPLWLLALYSVVRAAGQDDVRALCWPRWIGVGILIGLGGLAKYSAAFFYPFLGVYMLLWKRSWLRKPQVWVSGVVALLMQLPVIIWNAQHEWVGIGHLLWQLKGDNDGDEGTVSESFEFFGQFLGGQALVLGPIVAGLMLGVLVWMGVRLWQAYRRGDVSAEVSLVAPGVRFLMVVAAGIVGLFTAISFTAKVQANWPLLGTVILLVLLGVWLGQVRKRWIIGVAVAAVVLNAVLSLMLMDTYKMRDLGILPLRVKIDPTKDLRGWADMGNLLGLMAYKLDHPIILSSRYQTLAPLMFHTIGTPEFAYMNAEGKRLNEYDVWPMPSLTNRVVVYVNEQNYLPPKIKAMFDQCEPWHTLGVEEYGITTRKLSLWLCWSGDKTVAMR